MNDPVEYLRRYVDDGSQPAFAELVRGTVDVVYAAALRQTGGDAHLAEDVTQGVYLALARRAATLKSHAALTGWLYTTTRFLALKAVRTKVRWQRRETEANLMKTGLEQAEPTWVELRPVIDEAMSELEEKDRVAMLLRYFESQPLAQVGAALGMSENAARMRVDRALEKLRLQLARRGITSTAVALSGALVAQPVVSAPLGLAASVTATSLAGVAVAAPLIGFMSITKVGLGIVSAAVLGTSAFLVGRHQGSVQAEQRGKEITELAGKNSALLPPRGDSNTAGLSIASSLTRAAGADALVAQDRMAVSSTRPAPAVALQLLADLRGRGLLEGNITLLNRDGKLSRAFLELFYLTPDEQVALQQSVDRTRTQLFELEQAHATVTQNEQGAVVIDVKSFAKAGGAAYDALMTAFAETLGPERNAAYLALGATQVERALGQFGAPQRTLTFSVSRSPTDDRKYSVQEKYKLPQESGSRTGDFKTMREAIEYAGVSERLLPPGFGR